MWLNIIILRSCFLTYENCFFFAILIKLFHTIEWCEMKGFKNDHKLNSHSVLFKKFHSTGNFISDIHIWSWFLWVFFLSFYVISPSFSNNVNVYKVYLIAIVCIQTFHLQIKYVDLLQYDTFDYRSKFATTLIKVGIKIETYI